MKVSRSEKGRNRISETLTLGDVEVSGYAGSDGGHLKYRNSAHLILFRYRLFTFQARSSERGDLEFGSNRGRNSGCEISSVLFRWSVNRYSRSKASDVCA